MRHFFLGAWIVCAGLAAVPAHAADEDVDRAMAAARVKATAGDVVAQFSLGELLYYGSNDMGEAIEWVRKAAEQRYAPAEFMMGQLYDFGFGVERSERDALQWYRRAADHGSAAGQRQVAEFYRRGRGVRSDPSEAVRWYRRAADGDDLRAQYELGQMYFNGTGVARDYIAAYVWFDVAATQTPLTDNEKAILELRNTAAARMTPEQEATAARRAAQWRPIR